MFSTDFIFRQQENLVDNQKCQAGFRQLCNKILLSSEKTETVEDKINPIDNLLWIAQHERSLIHLYIIIINKNKVNLILNRREIIWRKKHQMLLKTNKKIQAYNTACRSWGEEKSLRCKGFFFPSYFSWQIY